MRDLDSINPTFMRPSGFSRIGGLGALLLTLLSIPFASGPVPDIPLERNPIVSVLVVMLITSIGLLVAPFLSKWDWRTKYFGTSVLCIVSFILFTLIPCIVLFVYGTAPLIIDAMVFSIYAICYFFWCRKFFAIYREIYDSAELREILYQEDLDAIYYSQRGDKYLLEKIYRFSQVPRDRYFVCSIVLACLLIPSMERLKELLGIPFHHIFLIVGAFPVSLMFAGLAVRSYLIFYKYPAELKKATGKEVYVDLVSNCQKLGKNFTKTPRR
ncbi:hypothetical protein [Massilia sp. BSC265]|uniref:hypothetical protein n=1 Tax=Massilia sp. BSC265 TaxID=1549812 RepID=UPI00126A4CF7|nr:hypothetical protein [Massilia sp. BSC265]